MFRPAFILSTFIMVAVASRSSRFPSDIERCRYWDHPCLSRVVTNILRTHYRGHRELNVIPFDPFHVESMILERIPGSPVNIELDFKNIDLIGMREGTIINVTGFTKEPSNFVYEIQVLYPQFIMAGPYCVDGSVFGHGITGEGNGKITFYDMIFNARANCSVIERHGRKYMNMDDMQLEFQTNKVTFALENLYNGDEMMGYKMNQLLNNNWQIVISEMRPSFEKAFAVIASYMNFTFLKIPYTDLFLQSE